MTQHASQETQTPTQMAFPPHLDDAAATTRKLTEFIQDTVAAASADGVVVNLSGGIDSTVAATLAVEALGSENVQGLILPADANADGDVDDAYLVAEELAIDYHVVDVQPLVDQFVRTLTAETNENRPDPLADATSVTVSPNRSRENHRQAVGNLAARLRMLIAYFEANTTSNLVLGTGNRTELLLGYFTKYGDGGVDVLPIGDLYKTQVRELAVHLDVRDEIIEKPPTAGLWMGQTDEDDLGASYERIDAALHHLVDHGLSPDVVAERTGLPAERVEAFEEMYERAAHKRRAPPTPESYEVDSR